MDFQKWLELMSAARAVFSAKDTSSSLNAAVNFLKLSASYTVITLDDQMVDYLDKINSDPAIHGFVVAMLERYLSPANSQLQSTGVLMLASPNEMEQLKAFNFDLDKIIALVQMLAQLIKTLTQ